MSKLMDFVYMAGNCPSDGCPEYFFNHKLAFDNEYARKAFSRVKDIIERYSLLRTHIPDDSPLRNPDEISDFVDKMKEAIPGCEDVTTIFSCKHGNILYQKSIRFKDVKDIKSLVKKIKSALPLDLEKEKNRPISSYFMKVQ